MAQFSHFCGGTLYYTLQYDGCTYMFPVDASPQEVGTATFSKDMKAIELMRWIRKAIENNEFVKIKS